MKLIHVTREYRLSTPASLQAPEAAAAWLSMTSDNLWRVLVDFHNWPEWIPTIDHVQQKDQESPARGTLLRVGTGRRSEDCSIDHWDPPSCLQFSMGLGRGELAYGFTIVSSAKDAQLLITLELERSLPSILRAIGPLLRWRLRRRAERLAMNLLSRIGTGP